MTIPDAPDGETAGPGRGPASKDVLRIWLPAALYIVLIMIMAGRPAPRFPRIPHIDKYVHAAAYAVLSLLSYPAFARSGSRSPLMMTLVLGIAVGMADEGIQALGRVRRADLYDIIADLMGAAIGALLIARFLKTVPAGIRYADPHR